MKKTALKMKSIFVLKTRDIVKYLSLLLRGVAYNSSAKGKSEITENCELEKWGTAKNDDVSNDDVSKENTEKENNKKVLFDNVTEEK